MVRTRSARKCKCCGKLGHYAKTCVDRQQNPQDYKISRQGRDQRRKRIAGMCLKCKAPSQGKALCIVCRRARASQRRTNKPGVFRCSRCDSTDHTAALCDQPDRSAEKGAKYAASILIPRISALPADDMARLRQALDAAFANGENA